MNIDSFLYQLTQTHMFDTNKNSKPDFTLEQKMLSCTPPEAAETSRMRKNDFMLTAGAGFFAFVTFLLLWVACTIKSVALLHPQE